MEIVIIEEFQNLIPPLTQEEFNLLEKSILEEGIRDPLVVWEDMLVDGHNRFEIAKKHNLKFKTIHREFKNIDEIKIWIIENQLGRRNISNFVRSELALEMKHIYAMLGKEKQSEAGGVLCQISDKAVVDTKKEIANIANVSHDTINKVERIKEKATEEQLNQLRNGEVSINEVHKQIKKVELKLNAADFVPLKDRFIMSPFSILDTRRGEWKQRKDLWINKGIESEVGRDAKSYKIHDWLVDKEGRDRAEGGGVSIFDPVLCELMYSWFCPAGGKVLDPFAGGSVRGIISCLLGRPYTGIDLSKEQITANYKQSNSICNDKEPNWIVGDSNKVLDTDMGKYDFIFSCPPYFDLEVYSDDPSDISNMDYEEFTNTYSKIITKSINKLKDDRFACFVVSDIRDKKGCYRNFVGDTVDCFLSAETKLYNELILINSVGSLPIRIGKQFKNRKIGKMHQNILVFYKGNVNNIKNNFGSIDIEV